MLHFKFRGNRTIGSGEEDLLRVFTIYMYGRGGHLGHAANKLSFPYPRRLQIKFVFDLPSGFGEDV